MSTVEMNAVATETKLERINRLVREACDKHGLMNHYQHYKNKHGTCRIVGFCWLTKDEEVGVMYRLNNAQTTLSPNALMAFVQPAARFFEEVTHDGKTVTRWVKLVLEDTFAPAFLSESASSQSIGTNPSKGAGNESA